jgi:acetyl-CoA C-acetyltransferase
MSLSDPIVIAAAARTPMGGFQGDLKDLSATQLGSAAIRAAIGRAALQPDEIGEALMGCVLPAGLGQAPARQAALGAGLPYACGAVTVNKVCGSGMKALMIGHDEIVAGAQDIVVAGGMESMTNAPYLLKRARSGYRMGHGQIIDHMFLDGLEDAYDAGRSMGTFAEECAEAYQFTRDAQDAYAIESLTRAKKAVDDGTFDLEITPVTVTSGRTSRDVTRDEQPAKAQIDKIPMLRPAFREDGTVTAASSASISDGAAAMVLMRRSRAESRGSKPLATLVAHATHSQAPSRFATAPVGALTTLSERTGWALCDVDLFEINEAFAIVPMAAMHDLDIPWDKINVHGGACALGHPIGASGARIVVTLLAALQRYGLKRGMACLCLGGGEATAVAVERI